MRTELIKPIRLVIPDEVQQACTLDNYDYHAGSTYTTMEGECAGHLLIMRFPTGWIRRFLGDIAAEIFFAAGYAKCGINRTEAEPLKVKEFFDHVLRKQCGFLDPEFGMDDTRHFLLVKGETDRKL